jgi:hypothetical protein
MSLNHDFNTMKRKSLIVEIRSTSELKMLEKGCLILFAI